jgi:hypothetical protein
MHTTMPGTQDSLLCIWVMTGRELIRWCEHLDGVAVYKESVLLWLAPTYSATALAVRLSTRRWTNQTRHRD